LAKYRFSRVESSSETSESSDEEEYGEERDLFVAQLYKFQEERGTPINRAPILGGKDIDLYRFYRVVQDYGGCKRVTTNQLWKKVLIKLHLSGCPGATPVTVRKAYIRYLAHFNSFYKRLGWSLDELSITSTINSPRERRLIRPAELMQPKISPSKAELDTAARVERSERRDSEREKNAAGSEKDSHAERKAEHDVSDEDGDGKKKKERKKMAKTDKTKDTTDPAKAKDPDEGYRPANIVSRFYLGQKVRAHHHGRWYDARVVTVDQPSVKEMAEIMEMADEEGVGLSSQAMTRLRVVLSSTRCFVHYLGWNSRYDESITLNKIRISEKDDQTSMDAITREMGDRIPKSRLDFLLRWSNSTDGVESLTREDDVVPTHLFSMSSKSSIGIPLKVATPLRTKTPTTGTSRTEHAMISPSNIGISPPLRSPTRGHDAAATAAAHHASPRVSSPPSVQVKRARTMSMANATKDSPTAAAMPSSSTVAPTTIYIATAHEKVIVTPPKKIISPPPPPPPQIPVEISGNFEFTSPNEAKQAKEREFSSPLFQKSLTGSSCLFKSNSRASFISVQPNCRRKCYINMHNEPPPKKRPSRVSSAKEKTPMEDGDVGVVVTAYCDFDLVAKSPLYGKLGGIRGSEALTTTDEHLRKSIEKVTHSCPVEVKKEEKEVKVENEAPASAQVVHHEESDAEPSGSGTPMRTDGEDNDKWSTSDNQSAGSARIMSPGRGRGCKRKRAPYNRHSIMVVDRKYVRTKTANKDDRKDDDSYGEEEEEEEPLATRDTFISMKNKTYRLMEQEHSLDNFDLLGLPPLGDLSQLNEDAIEMLEKRLNDLREIYHNSRAELLMMERKRRKRAEKRKERERASREALAGKSDS
ncbi:ARID/BRIGHT DNA binding domain protein, partial [Oesophagostomum dentatum]